MLQALMEHPWIGWLLLSILSVSGTVIAFLVRSKVSDSDTKMADAEKEIHKIRDNYLERFNKVDDRFIDLSKEMHLYHLSTMEKMGKVLSAVETQSNFCRFIQESKKQ